MKTIKLITVLLTAFIFSGYSQEKSAEVKQMLNNPQTREVIFKSILDNNDLTSKFMDEMMQRAAQDSMVCQHMCSAMMNDEHMANAIAARVIELQKKQDAISLEERKKRHETAFHKIRH